MDGRKSSVWVLITCLFSLFRLNLRGRMLPLKSIKVLLNKQFDFRALRLKMTLYSPETRLLVTRKAVASLLGTPADTIYQTCFVQVQNFFDLAVIATRRSTLLESGSYASYAKPTSHKCEQMRLNCAIWLLVELPAQWPLEISVNVMFNRWTIVVTDVQLVGRSTARDHLTGCSKQVLIIACSTCAIAISKPFAPHLTTLHHRFRVKDFTITSVGLDTIFVAHLCSA